MKKILISLLSIIFVISMISTVYAATGTISSGASADTVIKGKTFTVTLAANADNPIDGMYTKISYDKNVLSLESASAGENYGNSSSEGEILVTNNSSSTSPKSATLYTMTFKVLDSATVGNTTISFSESELHLNENGTINNVSTSIEKVTINVKADDTMAGGNNQEEPTEETPSNDNTNSGNTNTGNNGGNQNKTENKNQNVNSNKNTNKNTTKLPQTGAESTTLVAIVGLGIISIISYITYKKYTNI